jgi:hypothetical protein
MLKSKIWDTQTVQSLDMSIYYWEKILSNNLEKYSMLLNRNEPEPVQGELLVAKESFKCILEKTPVITDYYYAELNKNPVILVTRQESENGEFIVTEEIISIKDLEFDKNVN